MSSNYNQLFEQALQAKISTQPQNFESNGENTIIPLDSIRLTSIHQ